jgi:hypothetical protein
LFRRLLSKTKIHQPEFEKIATPIKMDGLNCVATKYEKSISIFFPDFQGSIRLSENNILMENFTKKSFFSLIKKKPFSSILQ